MTSTSSPDTPLAADHAFLSGLQRLGINRYGLPNNYTTDYEADDLIATLEAFERRNLPYAGTGRTLHEARQACYFSAPGRQEARIAVTASNVRPAVVADLSRSQLSAHLRSGFTTEL